MYSAELAFQAEIRDQEHQETLVDFMTESADASSSSGFWIGLADIDEEGTFMWQTTTVTTATADFQAWAVDQPDGLEDENCAAAMADGDFLWYI
jgi:hypothetical protein